MTPKKAVEKTLDLEREKGLQKAMEAYAFRVGIVVDHDLANYFFTAGCLYQSKRAMAMLEENSQSPE